MQYLLSKLNKSMNPPPALSAEGLFVSIKNCRSIKILCNIIEDNNSMSGNTGYGFFKLYK